MRRMLDPTKVGGLPSTIEFDKDGNRKVKKNLKVDGKLTLASLVSDTNPDGDITKELGGGTEIHCYMIGIGNGYYLTYSSKNYHYSIGKVQYVSYFTTNNKYKELRTPGTYPAGGYYYNNSDNTKTLLSQIYIDNTGKLKFSGYEIVSQSYRNEIELPSGEPISINQLF